MRVHRSLEVVYVDELVDVPAVSERRADRQSVLGVRVELFPRLHTQTTTTTTTTTAIGAIRGLVAGWDLLW